MAFRELLMTLAIGSVAGQVCSAQVKVFFGNLHSHTSYSDGSLTPEDAYRHARDTAGLDFLAVTEHNHLGRIANEPLLYSGTGSVTLISTANRFNVDSQFVALYGQEFSSISSGNHANVLEVQELIPASEVPNGSWNVLLDDWLPSHLDSQGQPAIVLLNHPATASSPNAREYGRDDFPTAEAWRTALDARASLINIVNGPSHDSPQPGTPSEAEFRRYLNLGFHLAPTADQDNHRVNWGSAADTRTGVLAPALTKADILEALRNGRVYATQDRNLRIVSRVQGELMGSRITGAAVPSLGTAVPIEVELDDDDEPFAIYSIQAFSDTIGGEEAQEVGLPDTLTGNGTASLEVPYVGGAQYIYLRITQTDDDDETLDLAWTAPVWLEPGGAAPIPGGQSAIALSVDRVGEQAKISNTGDAPVNLNQWSLLSVKGIQRFTFGSRVLGPGKTVVVTSGPRARTGTGFLRWSVSNIWNNQEDPAELYDADGHLVAEVR
jgi:trimeric autotransporter adhesin